MRNFLAGFRRGFGAGGGSPRFNAFITAILASISGPSRSATKINVSIATCHSGASLSAFGSFMM
jgi:hypothetical protein